MPGQGLRNAAVLAHVALAIGVAATLAGLETSVTVRLAAGFLALLPLALTLPGLMRSRAASLRWLALALVIYAGFGSVEVVATQTVAAAALFLFALLELGMVLTLCRRPAARSRGEREGL